MSESTVNVEFMKRFLYIEQIKSLMKNIELKYKNKKKIWKLYLVLILFLLKKYDIIRHMGETIFKIENRRKK